MGLLFKGFILGLIIVLPGMSGGTAFLIMGIYEDLVKDLVRLRIKPYLPLLAGMMVGIFIGGTTFAIIFENFRDMSAAFLLGCLLGSIRSILKGSPRINVKWAAVLAAGFIGGYALGADPIAIMATEGDIGLGVLIIGGALASGAMIIPGIPGSSVMILMGIYDKMLFSIRELDLRNIIPFLIGSILGSVSLVKAMDKIYSSHKTLLSYFFAGLVIGSSRAILPYTFNISIAVIFIIGFSFVWFWGGKD